MTKQFDLEQKIMECWRITTDLKDLNTAVVETNISKDDIANITLGLYQLYDLKFDQLFLLFEQHLEDYYKLKDEKQY